MIYLIGVTIEGNHGLHISDDNSFTGSENKEEAIALLPDYRTNHLRNYESSMSATIYQMTFGIKLLEFKDMAEVQESIGDDPRIKLAHHVSGRVNFVPFIDGYKIKIAHNGKFLPDDMKQG